MRDRERENTEDNIRYLDEKRREHADRLRDHSPNKNHDEFTRLLRDLAMSSAIYGNLDDAA